MCIVGRAFRGPPADTINSPTDSKLVTSSAENDNKLLGQLKSGDLEGL